MFLEPFVRARERDRRQRRGHRKAIPRYSRQKATVFGRNSTDVREKIRDFGQAGQLALRAARAARRSSRRFDPFVASSSRRAGSFCLQG